MLAIVAIQLGWTLPAAAQGSPAPAPPIEMLPLFAANQCGAIRDPADQLFCGDPALNAISPKLNSAIQTRLDRIPDRRRAIEENAVWIKARNSSCGIIRGEPVRSQDVKNVVACLLMESEERVAILLDPNFDCLASNSTTGTLICSDPVLALAEGDLNEQIHGLIAKMKENEAKDAFVEYARWTRSRDRKCNLVGKDNVPLQELESSEPCLADFMAQKTAEIAAARGDPKRVFGKNLPSPTLDADAIDLCVGQIHSANACGDFLRVSQVVQTDTAVSDPDALVTAIVEMVVMSPFAACSPVASSCTGTCWDTKTGTAKPTPGNRDSFRVAQRLKVEKSFTFKKADSGGWRCETSALQPVNSGTSAGAGP